MPSTRQLEKSIRDTLISASSRVEASELLSIRVKNAIKQQTQKEDTVMKKRFSFKSAMIMAAVLCLTTVTVFAASNISAYISHSMPGSRTTSFPTEESLQKDLGFVPKTVESFSNGYKFERMGTGVTNAVDKDGNTIGGDYKFVSYQYAFGQENVTLTINKVLPSQTDDPKAVKTDYKGLSLSYTSQKYKFVPVDYKMTEEDKRAQESGEIEFSYGSDTVKNSVIQNVIWIDNGISYDLMATDSNLTQADLITMAKEIVDK